MESRVQPGEGRGAVCCGLPHNDFVLEEEGSVRRKGLSRGWMLWKRFQDWQLKGEYRFRKPAHLRRMAS